MHIYSYQGWPRRKAMYTNVYLQPTERKELIQDCGVHGLVVFEYFLFLAKQADPEEITDDRIADWFGWTPATAKRHRLRLANKGWFHTEKCRSNNRHRCDIYYLGKEAVADASGKHP